MAEGKVLRMRASHDLHEWLAQQGPLSSVIKGWMFVGMHSEGIDLTPFTQDIRYVLNEHLPNTLRAALETYVGRRTPVGHPWDTRRTPVGQDDSETDAHPHTTGSQSGVQDNVVEDNEPIDDFLDFGIDV